MLSFIKKIFGSKPAETTAAPYKVEAPAPAKAKKPAAKPKTARKPKPPKA